MTGAATHPAGFAWIAPHARALRTARALFILTSALLALYVSAFAIIVLTCVRLAATDDDSISRPVRNLGGLGIALVIVAGYALITAAIAVIGRGGLPRRVRRFTQARPPEPDEAVHAQQRLESFALARGVATPRLWIIDDPAPNSCTFGRPTHGNVCLTGGALRFRSNELDALCAHQVTALTTRAYGYATAAVDLSFAAQWWTTALWATGALALVSSILGVPPEVAAATVLGIVLLVTITKPLLSLNDRVLPRLLDDVDALCDFETVRLTDEPTALAQLLLHMLEDRRQVDCRWEVAHRWFERDVCLSAKTRARSAAQIWAALPFTPDSDGPVLARRTARGTGRGLAARAAVAVQLAGGGDAALRARLAEATTVEQRDE